MSEDVQARLVASLKFELSATAIELASKVAAKRKSYRTWKGAEGRSTSEERQRYTTARRAYWEALYRGRELRLEIIDLQRRIQRIEGFWETDPDIKSLGDSAKRDLALWRLLMRNADYSSTDEEKESCRVNHVVTCPQREGPPMMAVFKAEDWDEGEGPARANGHIILFLASGSYVPFFENANVIESSGVVRDLNADGIIDIVDVIACSHDGGGWYQLYVLPVTTAQRDTLQVWWRESYDAEAEEILWGFEAVDPDGDGVHDIVIGPRAGDGGVEERARYVWSPSADQWIGPRGSTTGEFYRPDPDADEDLQVEAFEYKRALKPLGR